MKKGGDKFALLPLPEINASDEALYANTKFLEANKSAINILLEELIQVWREVNKNPDVIVELRKKYKLLPNLPKEEIEEILPYYREVVSTKAFSNNGGGVEAVKADFEFYGFSGTIKGDTSKLKVEDFWQLEPLNKAIAKLGKM